MLSPHQLEFNLFQHIPIYSNHFESFGPTFCLIHFFSVARNPDMENQDVVLVVGANDVVNSAAQAWVKPSWVISWNMIFGGFFSWCYIFGVLAKAAFSLPWSTPGPHCRVVSCRFRSLKAVPFGACQWLKSGDPRRWSSASDPWVEVPIFFGTSEVE